LSRDRKTATVYGGCGGDHADRTDCSRHEQRRPEKLGRRWYSRQSGAAANQWWGWTGTESPTSLDICHLTKLVGEVSITCADPWRHQIWRHLYTRRTAYLNAIRSGAFSQCSWRRSGVMWWNFSRAAAFITAFSFRTFDCRLRVP